VSRFKSKFDFFLDLSKDYDIIEKGITHRELLYIMKIDVNELKELLLKVEKPSRYVGGEYGGAVEDGASF